MSRKTRKLAIEDAESKGTEKIGGLKGGKSKDTFSFRVKLGEHEIEMQGTREDVLKTVEELPTLMVSVSKAFEPVKPKAPVVKVTSAPRAEQPAEIKKLTKPSGVPLPVPFPIISGASKCGDAVLKLLESDWGRWRPRTLPELVDALKANALHYPATTLSGVLSSLVKKGYVYILAEKGMK